MVHVDKGIEELKEYKPGLTIQEDFDGFWNETIEESKKTPLNSELKEVNYPIENIKVFDICYDGFKGARVNGWYILPSNKRANDKYPAIIYYHGYTKNKGFIQDYLKWLIQGYAVLAISIRGQGGRTPDNAFYSQGGIAGWMTKGILDKYEYYYRNVYIDAIRAIDFLCERKEIDADRIGIYGFSQGGGVTLAVAALDNRPKFAMPVEPFLCHFKRALETYQDGPYGEIYDYFRYFDPEMKSEGKIFSTLSYFDGMNLAARVKCPVLMAVGLMDTTCPPSTVFAAYNHLSCSKELKIYPHHNHEVPPYHEEAMIEFAAKHMKNFSNKTV